MTSSVLDRRYGRTPERRRRGRIGGAVAAGVGLLAVAAWAAWSGLGGSVQALDVATTAVTPRADSVLVRWTVTGRAGQALVCAIEGQDASSQVVGLVEERVPVTGSALRGGTTVVRTIRPASTGLIDSCRPA